MLYPPLYGHSIGLSALNVLANRMVQRAERYSYACSDLLRHPLIHSKSPVIATMDSIIRGDNSFICPDGPSGNPSHAVVGVELQGFRNSIASISKLAEFFDSLHGRESKEEYLSLSGSLGQSARKPGHRIRVVTKDFVRYGASLVGCWSSIACYLSQKHFQHKRES